MQRFAGLEMSFGLLAYSLSGAWGAAPEVCTEKVAGQGGHEDYACVDRTAGRRPIACYEQIEESCMEGEGRQRVRVFVRYTGDCQATYARCM